MLILQGCLIRLMSNMHTLCGCVGVFSPHSCQLLSIYRGRRSKSALTVRYSKWIFWYCLKYCTFWLFFSCNFCLENKLVYIKECYIKHVLFAVSKYLTLLIEIHPINNVRVLKAVDSSVRVQVKHSTNLKISIFNLLC